MPDKITMINMVWITMVTVMLAMTVTLYNNKVDVKDSGYSEYTSRYQHLRYY